MGKYIWLFFLFLFFPVHCGPVLDNSPHEIMNGTPKNMIFVPIVEQQLNYTCGVATTRSMMLYFDDEMTEEDLAEELKTDPTGTTISNIQRFLESRGYEVKIRTGMTLDDLTAEISAGTPVTVLLQAWSDEPDSNYKDSWGNGHFAIVMGYDEKLLYFMDPSTTGKYTYIPIPEFLDRWHDIDEGPEHKVQQLGMTIAKKDGSLPTPFSYMN